MNRILIIAMALMLVGCAGQSAANGPGRDGPINAAVGAAGPGPAPSAPGPAIDHLVAELRAGGFEAKTIATPPNPPKDLTGLIRTGVEGFTVIVAVFRCPGPETDDAICNLIVSATVIDDRNVVNDHFLTLANAQTLYVKSTKPARRDGRPALALTAAVFCKGLDYAKLLPQFLRVYGGEMSRVMALYRAQPAYSSANR